MKIAVPAPALAAGTLAAIAVAALLLMRPSAQPQRPAAAAAAASFPALEAKIVEVPVEREIARERIITRTIYVRQPRPARNDRGRPAAGQARSPVNEAARSNAAERGFSNEDRQLFVRASVEGFRPVTDANLRIVKEPEQ